MPLKTPHYELEAFRRGESYSAAVDRRRFLIIDSQLALLSDIVGDGRLDGWNVTISDKPSLEVSVSSGLGLISRFTTRTFNEQKLILTDNQTTFLFMKRKPGVIGGFSEFSNMAGIVVSDSTPPSVPIGLIFSSITFNSISLDWDDNTEADFSHYVVLRSLNGIDFEEIATVSDSNFTDEGLDENTVFYYKLKAVDLSGNESSETTAEMVKTLKDLREPLPPSGINAVSGNSIAKLFWFPSSAGNISRYEAAIQPLDASLKPLGSSFVQSVPFGKNQMVVTDLDNGTPYQITLFSVSNNEVFSEGVSKLVSPRFSRGPADVEDINISFSEGDNDSLNVVMNISWTPGFDPYISNVADSYQITIIENGTKTSDPIVVREGFDREIRIIPFTDEDGNSSFESVKPVTNYFVIVKAVDVLGRTSAGTPAFSESPSFEAPASVTDARAFVNDDNSITTIWTNSTSQHIDHNEITIASRDSSTGDETILFEDVDIGNSSSFTLDSSFFSEGTVFEFTVIVIDRFGNSSVENTFITSTISSEGFPRPVPPPDQTVSVGNGSATLRWTSLDENLIDFYRIWRAPFQLFTTPDLFEIVDTIPSSLTEYTDFDVENGSSFMYFVTSIDIFGRESENPIDDSFVSNNLLVATPRQTGSIIPPEDLMVSKSGFDAILTWADTGGAFDGYEIFFSEANKFGFEKVGSASSSDTSFTHKNALLKDGVTYFYLVRKIRNEASVFATTSNVIPLGSIALAEVRVSNGEIAIDETPAIELKNLEDPIREETKKQLAAHKHILESDGTDKRIDLSSDVIVEDWTTTDFQNYFTDSDLEGASAFAIKLDGEINESFFSLEGGGQDLTSLEQLKQGVSPFLFEVNEEEGRLTFDTPLFSNEANAVTPFASPPDLTVILFDIREVKGTLPSFKTGNLSATQITSGFLSNQQIPDIQHDGRFNQKLIPLSENLQSPLDNGFTYEFEDNSVSMQIARTFYDVLQVSDNRIIAATSQGILLSDDFGVSWGEAFLTTTAPSKFFFSSVLNKYLALTNDAVWIASGDLDSWVKMPGLDNVKVVRDIKEDGEGNLFISTDLGVYKLSVDVVSQSLTWSQTPLFGPNSTESYALLFDRAKDRMIVSNELGILESKNSGASWTFTSEFEETEKIFVFLIENDFIFALTNFVIWRKGISDSTFTKIFEFESDLSRKMVIFGNRIYVTVEDDILVSDATSNIFSDSSIKMKRAFSDININNNVVPVTSLNVIGDLLFIGTDRRLFIRRLNNDIWIQSEFLGGKIPTVFVNNKVQRIGFRYFVPRGSVSFDDKLEFSDKVAAAIQYKKYRAENNGWASHKYDSRIIVKKNNKVIVDSNKKDVDFALNVEEFSTFQFPEFDETNSFVSGAGRFKQEAEQSINSIVNQEAQDLSVAVAEAFNNIEKFFSQTFPELRTAQLPFTDEEQEQINQGEEVAPRFVELPDIEVSISDEVSVNVVTGVFTFTGLSLNKYDIMTADILGSTLSNTGDLTHKELEDQFELFNSGLTSSLSRVQQSNIVKLGIFNEKQWPGQQTETIEPFQAKYIIPRNQKFYDVLNSTVDYSLEDSLEQITFTLPYAATAVFIEETNRVLVGGRGGILGIDADNLDIDEFSLPVDGLAFVKQLHLVDNVLYALTETDLFISENGGVSWSKVSRNGLPNSLFSIGIINNTIVIGAIDGIYFKTFTQDIWTKVLDANNPVEVIIDPDFLFAIVDDQVFLTSNGSVFIKNGEPQKFDIYSLAKYKSLIFAATSKGLRKDDSTFYGGGAVLSLADVFNDTGVSESIIANDVDGDESKLVVGFSDGQYAVFDESGFATFSDEPLKTIQQVLLVNGGIWLFGYDLFTVPFLDHPVKLTTGVPI